MAKEKQEDAVKPQESQTPPDEQAQTQTDTGADNAESAVENAGESQADDKEGQVIVPIGYSVKLREIHPQASYGRCGYRFNKTEAVYLPVEDLTAEQVLTLAEDPWLELIPVCEE
ncbi:hypothetical protein HYE60_03335 [Aggregatibacter actinomycetemcomitans]|uniref:hypothetical protein n=1 Tax=Aggregatibacter actinomycetemcomitans TaxID=714 RepID=UPI00197C6264|nr:hypothetical protein [Aggregatibacter actinomycetemcomitans]MBN6074300.1 hypothetical protein [Aggregatibacter actinomycetemcomitans]